MYTEFKYNINRIIHLNFECQPLYEISVSQMTNAMFPLTDLLTC